MGLPSSRLWHRCVVSTIVLASCSFTPGKLRSDSDVVMEDGRIDTIPDASTCVAASVECIGDTLRVCAAAGEMAVERNCGWGCDASGAGRCKEIVPAANAVMTSDLVPEPALADLVLGDGINIDTGYGEIGTLADSDSVRPMGMGLLNGIRFNVVNNIGVLRVKSLRVTASMNAPMGFQFTNPIAIVADGPIEIAGHIVVRTGDCTMNNGKAGGFAGGTAEGNGQGPGAGLGGLVNSIGGSGGGHGGMGGGGGTLTSGVFNTGGAVYGDAIISVLQGGSGGGGGGGGGQAQGGSGGGAIQLVSNTSITITSGGINAGGCGGQSKDGGSDAGGGGGAGGTILLEAPTITIAAAAGVAANGGGGGGGDVTGAAIDGFAEAGKLSRAPAMGTPGGNGGSGGDGAAGANINGANGGFLAGEPGGGGGGAMGRIRFNTRMATTLVIDANAILSPSLAETLCTRGDAAIQ